MANRSFTKESEKLTEAKLVKFVKEHGGKAIKLLSDYDNGLPDRLLLFPEGIAVFVETKSEGEKPRKLQLIRHKELRALGFTVLVIDKAEQIDQLKELI